MLVTFRCNVRFHYYFVLNDIDQFQRSTGLCKSTCYTFNCVQLGLHLKVTKLFISSLRSGNIGTPNASCKLIDPLQISTNTLIDANYHQLISKLGHVHSSTYALCHIVYLHVVKSHQLQSALTQRNMLHSLIFLFPTKYSSIGRTFIAITRNMCYGTPF